MKLRMLTTLALTIFSTIIGVAQNTNFEYANLIRDVWELCSKK